LNEKLQEDEQYDGADNGIIYSRVYKMKLLCKFEQHNYPFDSQTCFIKVFIIFLSSLVIGTFWFWIFSKFGLSQIFFQELWKKTSDKKYQTHTMKS